MSFSNLCLYTDENKHEKPPFDCSYYQFPFNFEDNITKRMIGKDGYYFKNITHKFKLRYVWLDQEKQIIEIWGSNPNIFNFVKNYILNRTCQIIKSDIENGFPIYSDTLEWYNEYAEN